jgi:soluble lytic murein transglycosylase-like protein
MCAVRPGRGVSASGRWLRVAALGAGVWVAAGVAADPGNGESMRDVAPATPARSLVAEAVAYEHGEGVARDPMKAAELYCEAARDGDVDATFALGWMYANGRGLARDDTVARALFAIAAESGHVQAQRMLGYVGTEAGALPDCMRPPAPAAESLPSADFAITVEDDDPFARMPAWKQKIADVVKELAPRYAVEPRLALAFIAVESNFESTARSDKDARGLMQLIPDTATRFNVRNAYDVKENVRGGLAYLRWLLAYYQGNVRFAAAAYNAGEKAVDKYGGIPPYAETRDYVRRIQRLFRREVHPYDARIADPSPILSPGVTPGS